MNITNTFKRHTKRIAVAVFIPFMTACSTLTKEEGQAIGAGLGAIVGEIGGKDIEDRRIRNAVTIGTGVIGGTVGGAIADKNIVCNQESSERRDTNVDYRTGETTRNTGSGSTIDECVGGRQSGTRKPLGGIQNN